jgi:hypothetical protein
MSFRRDGYVICIYISTIFQRFNLFFLFVCLLCSSCTNMANLPSPIIPEATAEKTQSVAELNFINGNFESALLEYEQIFETSLSPEDRNLALYGLACTQMMLARSDEQLLEAISNLQRWDASKGSAPLVENRHLLVLALKQQGEFLKEKTEGQLKHEKQKNSVIAYQKKKISLMASTLTKLQKQLEELEAIDETFQEIRNPL